MGIPGVGAPRDERERRQLRATYYGAQREVDDGLAPLFDYLERSGLAESTLVVLTSDHGEMGGDHWLLEKLGYWDESYHVPLIVVDPRPEADRARGSVVEAVTESVDVLPTICEFMGVEVPAAGRRLVARPLPARRAAPEHWRDTAHFEWSFSDPANQRGRDDVRHPDEPLRAGGVRVGPGTSTSSSRPTPRLFRRCCSTCPATPNRRHNLLAEGGAGRDPGRLGGHPGAAPVADAHGGADAERQLPPSRSGDWSRPATPGGERRPAAPGSGGSGVEC